MPTNFSDDLMIIIEKYLNETKALINEKQDPEKESKAFIELELSKAKDLTASVFSLGVILREVAADNLLGIQRVLTEPVMSYAPFVLFRGLMEMTALSLWLMSTKIDNNTRVARYLRYKRYSLDEYRKYANSLGNQELIDYVTTRNVELSKVSSEFTVTISEYRLLESEDVQRDIPSRTAIIKECLDAEDKFRLFSGIAHGQHWAIIQSCFKKTEVGTEIYEGVKGGLLEKSIPLPAYIFLCLFSITYLTKCEIEQFDMYGWDSQKLKNIEQKSTSDIGGIVKKYNIHLA
ncbi:MAG: hypothetical protein JW725_03550 [Candidatus Babeliaceae bacterium]|nr:hypothetical protein [Candidatus Babeliaceae bacterium]